MPSILLFAALLLGSSCSHLPDQIAVDGNRFVRPNGEAMVFRGLALADPSLLKSNGYWNKKHFKQARAWNADLVRIPVIPRRWRDLGKDEYLRLLDDGIKWAAANQLYVVIDWHSMGNLKDNKYQRLQQETTLKETLDFWETIAARYAGNPTVAFYEIFNEPTDFFGKLGELPWDDWRDISKTIVAAIRQHDTQTIPVVAGLKWGYDLSEAREKPFDIEGIAYSIHPYPMKSKEPWEENWEKTWGFVADTYPMIALEFGYMKEDDPGAHIPCITTDEAQFGERIINYLGQKGISWTAWCFFPNWSPTLIDKNYNPAPGQGEFFHRVLTEAITHFPINEEEK
ncbi:glycoside hydrolase family 5 protein [Pontiella sulfatireligans]|uniref:glycoside hydrolase family 5 protein n=1 Tax=Pontiella sulfatireligans TaxID=2750658 RepID=UPI0014440CE9|nr:cellulase family glycosylhydrolase [Pontiella sulfatireligans]